MARLLFEKSGNAVWISHLDLMRLFQRAFKRAGLLLHHTQGFNPRPSVSIALPMSVGLESGCELLDFDLEGEPVSCEQIREKLNHALIDGVTVLSVYENGQKLKHLALMDCVLTLEYDSGVPADAPQQIRALFAQPVLTVEKRSKNGVTEQNIIPMIKTVRVSQTGDQTLTLEARICCQNPTLNPMQLSAAVEKYLPQWKPDFVRCRRTEIFDQNEELFR